MSDTFNLWTHGVAVIPEFTREYTGDDNGLNLLRAGWGAQVEQNRGTENWFHFAIPSATKLDDDKVSIYHAWLRARINNDAVIDRVHIREATGPESQSPRIFTDDHLNITGQDDHFDFNIRDHRCRGPIVMCVHVRFEGDNGKVVFTAAGGRFEEWT